MLVVHINPALAGVLAAFAFGGRAEAGGNLVLILVALLLATVLTDLGLALARRRHVPSPRVMVGR